MFVNIFDCFILYLKTCSVVSRQLDICKFSEQWIVEFPCLAFSTQLLSTQWALYICQFWKNIEINKSFLELRIYFIVWVYVFCDSFTRVLIRLFLKLCIIINLSIEARVSSNEILFLLITSHLLVVLLSIKLTFFPGNV